MVGLLAFGDVDLEAGVLTIRDGKAIPSSAPGLGIAWDLEAIERMTVDGTHTIIV